MSKQRTIKNPVSISGVGLHTGKNVTLTFVPAPANHGYKFKRVDLENQPVVSAEIGNVVDTSRGTTIEQIGVRIHTVEHVLAALAGMSIDNVMIEMDWSETPILDGSCKLYVESLIKAEIVEQNADRLFYELNDNIVYTDAALKVEMIAIPSKEFKVTTMIDYDNDVLGTQFASIENIKSFKDEIAKSRTFVFISELEYLIENNLIKGGDLNNAIVFVNRIISQEELDKLAHIFNKPKITVLKEGILNNLELNSPNEPARHKLLDIIGDLALLGVNLKAHIIAKRPGHLSNIEFAKKIKKQILSEVPKKKPFHIDIHKTPVLDINDIKKILPHRPPFLFVDKILELDNKKVVGLKNVTMNESFFIGHFPDEPVMPGVIQVEAMAQVGGIFVLKSVPDPENYLTYFLKIENARFKQKVIPGDTLVFDLELVSPIRRGICHMRGVTYVDGKIVMEAELLAQIVKKEKK
jgi:UDP-3-O-[3-hydroxymyristoyl] N-acetylglucosamine deacetylase/3-hydroxyacyl-[acyl-carrier-protein] dehydratase